MANVTISPNMNLTIPTVSVDPGPDWANNINASLVAIDGHDHTAGKGVPVPSAGLNINSDLPFNNNNATTLRSVRFQPQVSNINLPTDLGALYEVGTDLWFNDGAGNNIRITQSGSLAGAAGTITGLPSGTASAVYQSISGTFIFQSATNTPANIDVASVTLRNFTAGSFGLTLNPPLAMTSNFNLTLPNIPPSNSFMTIDTTGAMAGSVPLSQGITTSMIADGSITAAKLATGAAISTEGVSFTANGTYKVGNAIDNYFTFPFNATILSVWVMNEIAGTAGITSFDLKIGTSGGSFASVLSTTGQITSAAVSGVYTDSGSVVAAQTGVTKPTISLPNVLSGQAIRFDLLSVMTNGKNAKMIVFFKQA